jgi:hypothetical protein
LSSSVSRAKQQGKRYGNPDGNMTHGKRTASKNHLESPSPINVGRRKKYVFAELQGRPIMAPSADGPTLSAFLDQQSQISRYGVGGKGDSSHQKAVK